MQLELKNVSYIGILFKVWFIQDSVLFRVWFIQDSVLFRVRFIQDSLYYLLNITGYGEIENILKLLKDIEHQHK